MRVIVYQASDTSALSKNFTRKDFKCPCGCTRQMVDSELVEKLQAIRDKLGKAIKVTSGYRCIMPAKPLAEAQIPSTAMVWRQTGAW